jgi:hypothetical protein
LGVKKFGEMAEWYTKSPGAILNRAAAQRAASRKFAVNVLAASTL